ncbi:MAG: hypothetical protein HY329_14960 [Chloroflexi bacterium]|nr:hypothetical protein [Chloroflexota bacterium]
MSIQDLVRELDLENPALEAPSSIGQPAPRLDSLKGKRVGLLDNTKGNVDVILQTVADVLVREYGAAESVFRSKYVYSRRAEPALLDDLAATCDLVITAVGD